MSVRVQMLNSKKRDDISVSKDSLLGGEWRTSRVFSRIILIRIICKFYIIGYIKYYSFLLCCVLILNGICLILVKQ